MNVEHSFPVEHGVRHHTRPALIEWIRKRRWLAMFVILPTLLATLYYGLIASDVYVSESRFVIKSPDRKGPQISSLANLIQTSSLGSGQEQTSEVLDYVRSRNALQDLMRRFDVRGAFASDEADALSRFPGLLQGDTFEQLYEYYGERVDADLDTETGSAMIRVEAFTPEDAQQINVRLLGLSEELVNRLNARARTRGISEAETRVAEAQARLRNARIQLAQYRDSSSLIDPAEQAGGVLEISNTLIAQRAALQAQLDQMRRVAPANPSIPALSDRIATLSRAIANQEGRVVGGGGAISAKLPGYEALAVEQEFATENLNVASAALIQAQTEAAHQQFYLERIVDPNVPDEPLLPRRIWSILVVAVICVCLYFIGWMLIVGILEHAPED